MCLAGCLSDEEAPSVSLSVSRSAQSSRSASASWKVRESRSCSITLATQTGPSILSPNLSGETEFPPSPTPSIEGLGDYQRSASPAGLYNHPPSHNHNLPNTATRKSLDEAVVIHAQGLRITRSSTHLTSISNCDPGQEEFDLGSHSHRRCASTDSGHKANPNLSDCERSSRQDGGSDSTQDPKLAPSDAFPLRAGLDRMHRSPQTLNTKEKSVTQAALTPRAQNSSETLTPHRAAPRGSNSNVFRDQFACVTSPSASLSVASRSNASTVSSFPVLMNTSPRPLRGLKHGVTTPLSLDSTSTSDPTSSALPGFVHWPSVDEAEESQLWASETRQSGSSDEDDVHDRQISHRKYSFQMGDLASSYDSLLQTCRDGPWQMQNDISSSVVAKLRREKEYQPMCRILPWLWLGGCRDAADYKALRRRHVKRVLNCCWEMPNFFPDKFEYLNMPVDDLAGTLLRPFFPITTSFLAQAKQNGERVYVHCAAGVSRSTSVVMAYLVAALDHSLSSAFALVRKKRRTALPNTSFLRQLGSWEIEQRSDSTLDQLPPIMYPADFYPPVGPGSSSHLSKRRTGSSRISRRHASSASTSTRYSKNSFDLGASFNVNPASARCVRRLRASPHSSSARRPQSISTLSSLSTPQHAAQVPTKAKPKCCALL